MKRISSLKHVYSSPFKDPVYQRIRELLVLKEQLEKQLEEGRREQASRANRSVTSPAPPRIHSPVHT